MHDDLDDMRAEAENTRTSTREFQVRVSDLKKSSEKLFIEALHLT